MNPIERERDTCRKTLAAEMEKSGKAGQRGGAVEEVKNRESDKDGARKQSPKKRRKVNHGESKSSWQKWLGRILVIRVREVMSGGLRHAASRVISQLCCTSPSSSLWLSVAIG